MDAFSSAFVRRKFSEFYNSPSTTLPSPTGISQREFAFFLFKERAMVRHRGVVNLNGLRKAIADFQPSDIYYSCAYYENPEADMERKGWLGADLVFDIDADHIPTSCDKIHDEWVCGKCGFSGKGPTPEICPACDAQKFDTKSWPCERCINSAKDETIKLVDILRTDFGFSEGDIRLFFSGHRGYHVHVEAEAVRSLDAMARKEIVDYVYGLGLTMLDERQNSKDAKKRADRIFQLQDFGWNKRITTGMQKFVLSATKQELNQIGIRQCAEGIIREREVIAKKYIEEGRWSGIKGLKIGPETWLKIARHVKDLESAHVDTVVTTDIHRLIRMNGTLHSKSGLLKIEFTLKELPDFDPFREAVAFKEGNVRVIVSSAPQFRLGEATFGPYTKQEIELPTAAAILLICKGRAEVMES
jgi:DNA primase small subunit